MSLIRKKKEKIFTVLDSLGAEITEENFIKRFKEMYPADWKRVQERWLEGIPDMQHPDVYMKEMYRNHVGKRIWMTGTTVMSS